MKHNWNPDRRLARAGLALLLVLVLAGCTTSSVLPRQPVKPPGVLTYKLSLITPGGQAEDSLLVVQPEAGEGSRWIQTNPLGAPLARYALHDSQWSVDGFLPPNPQARQLFEAIIAAQMPQDQWPAAYPDLTITTVHEDGGPAYLFHRQGRRFWSLQLPATGAARQHRGDLPPQNRALRITLADHSQWRLTPIPQNP